jgi:hypothetical protein
MYRAAMERKVRTRPGKPKPGTRRNAAAAYWHVFALEDVQQFALSRDVDPERVRAFDRVVELEAERPRHGRLQPRLSRAWPWAAGGRGVATRRQTRPLGWAHFPRRTQRTPPTPTTTQPPRAQDARARCRNRVFTSMRVSPRRRLTQHQL